VANIICGVDVSSAWLDGRIGLYGPSIRVKRTPKGVEDLRGFCAEHGVELVVMEATGGYERLAFGLLWEAGVACAVVNPRSVRRFAEAMGFLEKTDRIDAGVIADYGGVKRLVGQAPASPTQTRLRALVVRLRQLTGLKVAQTNQRRLVEELAVKASFDELLALVRRQIEEIEAQILALLDSDPLWRELDEVFRQIKGVADRTIASLMADMPEIGTLSNKAVAKLAGLAPIANDSGRRQGRRSVRGGRAQVRSILFTIASGVRRYNPDFAAFHSRLIEAGKSKKAARVAVARKLLVRLNAKARDVRAAIAA
jgi:transposase